MRRSQEAYFLISFFRGWAVFFLKFSLTSNYGTGILCLLLSEHSSWPGGSKAANAADVQLGPWGRGCKTESLVMRSPGPRQAELATRSIVEWV